MNLICRKTTLTLILKKKKSTANSQPIANDITNRTTSMNQSEALMLGGLERVHFRSRLDIIAELTSFVLVNRKSAGLKTRFKFVAFV